jgi:hypothetical protein
MRPNWPHKQAVRHKHYSGDKVEAELEAANERAVELIALAQGLFGPMSSDWEYRGVAFYDHPPHLNYSPDSGTVQIWLSLRALGDVFQRDFQLAHEVCHLLYPSVAVDHPVEPKTNLVNEGISTYFSVIAVNLYHGEDAMEVALQSLQSSSPRYYFAFLQVSSLLGKDRDAVKKIRRVQPMVNDLTFDDIRACGLTLSDQEIESLIEPF